MKVKGLGLRLRAWDLGFSPWGDLGVPEKHKPMMENQIKKMAN